MLALLEFLRNLLLTFCLLSWAYYTHSNCCRICTISKVTMVFFSHFQARKAVQRLKGAVRFNVQIHGQDTQKQASSTLSHIHSWSNIQTQIRARRHHMVTEGRIKQKKLENQLKLDAKLQELEVLLTITYLDYSFRNLINETVSCCQKIKTWTIFFIYLKNSENFVMKSY